MGAGRYSWQTSNDQTSAEEQRDNVLQGQRALLELFGKRPKSWGMPDRATDKGYRHKHWTRRVSAV